MRAEPLTAQPSTKPGGFIMSNRVPLPAGTVLGKSYEYGLDVNL